MDRENVLKAWECCNPFNRKCNECPYEKDCYHDGISRHMVAEAISLLKEDCHNCKLECLLQKYDQLKEKYDKLMKEQETHKFFVDESGKITPLPVVVRCKDCEHCYFASNRVPDEQSYACEKHGIDVTPDWYCADGVAKDINVPNKEGR